MIADSCVIDASVLLSALFIESTSEAAWAAIDAAGELAAPDLMIAEATSVMSRKVRCRELDLTQAHGKLQELRDMPISLSRATELDSLALSLSIDLPHPVYDCFYLALAIQRECTLLTLDRKLAHRAERAGFGDFVQLVGAGG
ncbi:MAG: hypothetical protein CVT60_02745 [Actinobacteria bacterium HGW-Actinobacteria-10]|nr:MAG: hypothetical protein CVT60_02745 [Actinobacteria bacterium HGW-Actinobacteria-10]